MGSAAPAQWQEDEKDYLATMKLVSHFNIAMAVKAAIELDVFNILACAAHGAYLTAGEIASQIPNCNLAFVAPNLDRILRFLASHEILRWSSTHSAGIIERRYAIEPKYKLLAKNEDGNSLAPAFLVIGDKVSLDSWQYLNDYILEGVDPFEKANGMKLFEYMGQKKNIYGGLFDKFMANVTKLTTQNIIDAYQGFEGINTLVDVGGGTGALLEIIIKKYPNMKGINFDQSHVISKASNMLGVEHISGDIMTSIPRGDAILLKWILHDWNDEDCIQILKNCNNALPIKGKVIIIEHILPELPESCNAVRDVYYMDVCMMIICHQGKERSEHEFSTLASASGFSEFKVACYAMNYHVMEFIK